MIKDEDIVHAIKGLAQLNIGFYFELSGSLCIRELDNGEFAVSIDLFGSDSWENIFSSLEKAIDCFLNARKKYELGEDYEQKRENVQIDDLDIEFYSFANVEPEELWLVVIIEGQKNSVLIDASSNDYSEYRVENDNCIYPAVNREKSVIIIGELVLFLASTKSFQYNDCIRYENGGFSLKG